MGLKSELNTVWIVPQKTCSPINYLLNLELERGFCLKTNNMSGHIVPPNPQELHRNDTFCSFIFNFVGLSPPPLVLMQCV